MEPTRDDDALVDVLDVLLRDGIVLRADVIVSVAEIPLIGIKLTAVVAGMETMTEYGLFQEWDTSRREAAVSRRQYRRGTRRREPAEPAAPGLDQRTAEDGNRGDGNRDEEA